MPVDEQPLASRGGNWKRLFATNVAAASADFVSGGLVERPITNVKANPFEVGTNLAIIDLVTIPTSERPEFAAGAAVPNSIMFQLFGTDANNETFSGRFWGITQAQGLVGSTSVRSWKPTLLAEVLATLGAAQGVANTLVEAADFYADTYALTYGSSSDVVIANATDLRGAWFRLDHLAFPLIAVEFQEGTAATCNGLWRPLW